MFVHLYLLSCNYFWMLCEGIYLHTLIVVAVFAEKQHLVWYYLLGWGKSATHLCVAVASVRGADPPSDVTPQGFPWCQRGFTRSRDTATSTTGELASVFLNHVPPSAPFDQDVGAFAGAGSVRIPRCSTSSTRPSAPRWW